jgi:phosphate transport system protein
MSYFHRQMDDLKDHLLEMGGVVEQVLADATAALVKKDQGLAQEVIKADRRIDLMENEIAERCLSLLATQQPVAVDLRFLSSCLKITRFLERLGDQCVNLAERVLALGEMDASEVSPTLSEMCLISREMTRGALDALAARDVSHAQLIVERDDELDKLNRDFLEEMIALMNQEQRVIRSGVEYILASRHLERVGDEATNVAEEVVFQVEGTVIRHQDPEPSVGPL